MLTMTSEGGTAQTMNDDRVGCRRRTEDGIQAKFE